MAEGGREELEGPIRDLVISLRAEFRSLLVQKAANDVEMARRLDEVRREAAENRASLRSDLIERIKDVSARFERAEVVLWDELKKKADLKDFDPIKKNLNSFVMFVLITVATAVLGMVLVNRLGMPDMSHASAKP